MKVRFLSMVLSLAALLWAVPVQAQTAGLKPDEVRRNAVEAEQELARQFADFQKNLQSLKNRLDRSADPSDKDRAAQLQKVLDEADSAGIRIKFTRLQELLRKDKFVLDNYKEAAEKTRELAQDFAKLVDLFEGKNNRLAEEINLTKLQIKALDDIIKAEKQLQLITELGKTDKNKLAKAQDDVTKDTKNLIPGKNQPKDPKNSEGGETKDLKSQPKEGKGDDKKAEARDAGKKNQGEAKENGPKDAKDNKAGEPKAKGADKGAEKKPGTPETKVGEKKDGKGSENKEASAKDNKGAKGPQAEPKDAKGGEAKQADAKDAGKKDGAPPKAKEAGEAKGKDEPKNEAKTAEPKAKEKNNDDNKAGAKDSKKGPEAKQADAKDAGKDSKQAEAKAGDPKGDAKDGPKSSAKGQPMDPKAGGDPPQAKGDKNDKADQPPPQAGNEKDPPIGKKQIQDAIDKMDKAKKDIEAGKNNDAADKQDDAIRKLEEAKRELEKRLKILREEELERLLANLKTRLERMLAMQRDVLSNQLDGTIATFQAVQLNADKKPADPQIQASFRLAAKEKDIVNEATKTIEILEGEGSAVAFPVAMQQVREDMKHVHRRLDGADVGLITQAIEKDIIESLEDMIKAVEKKKDDMDKKKDKDKAKPPSDKESGPPPDQKLLDQIAELKLIRAMQIQLNKRTELYSRQFPGQEQPADPNLRREIGELRDRQDRIYDITNKIQKGDNK